MERKKLFLYILRKFKGKSFLIKEKIYFIFLATIQRKIEKQKEKFLRKKEKFSQKKKFQKKEDKINFCVLIFMFEFHSRLE